MSFITGEDPTTLQFIVYVIIMALMVICFYYQVGHLQKMTILPVYLLPFGTFCILFENWALAMGSLIHEESAGAYIAYIFHSFNIPILLTCMVEVSYRLYETRSAQFFFIRFDEAESEAFTPVGSIAFLYGARLLSLSLLVLTMAVDFRYPKLETGGYITLVENVTSLPLWLSLIPPILLSIVCLFVSVAVMRYGLNMTIGLTTRKRWRVVLLCSLCLTVGYVFQTNYYPFTSNFGEATMLVGVSFLIYLVQEDLFVAGSFADYLHKSNLAFTLRPGDKENNADEPMDNSASTTNINGNAVKPKQRSSVNTKKQDEEDEEETAVSVQVGDVTETTALKTRATGTGLRIPAG
jgi:hypothetical protein